MSIPNWAPETWDDVTTKGLLLVVVVGHIVGYMRRWFIPGKHHDEIVGTYERALDKADERAAEDAKTIQIQAETISEKNAVEIATTKILAALREGNGGSS